MKKNIIIGVLVIMLGLMAITAGFEAWIIAGCDTRIKELENIYEVSSQNVFYLLEQEEGRDLTIMGHMDPDGKIIISTFDAMTGEAVATHFTGGSMLYVSED